MGFAETVLLDASRLWLNGDADQKQRLQWALFPEGLRFEDGTIGTGVTCLAFSSLAAFGGTEVRMASPSGIEPESRP